MAKPINKFFDLNKLPAEEGILVFPISMDRISNSQSAKKCGQYLKVFSPKKIVKPLIGVNFVYTDQLYFNSSLKASDLKKKFSSLVISHKQEFLKFLDKNPYYIRQAFSFSTWNQTILEVEKNFWTFFGELRKKYKQDKEFRKYVKYDLKRLAKGSSENQVNFILEEILLVYLVSKGQVNLRNDFIQGHEKWILWCYPGKPLKSQIYLTQKNFFGFENEKNKYEKCFYDLEQKKLYDFDRVDLDSLNLE